MLCAKADSLAQARAASDRFSAEATSASLRADSITRALRRSADSVRRQATTGSAHAADLEKQLASTRRELQRVLASTATVTKLSDSVRSTSSSAVESLTRQNGLLRDQLAEVNAIARSLRAMRGQALKSDRALALRLDSLALRLARLSSRQEQAAAVKK